MKTFLIKFARTTFAVMSYIYARYEKKNANHDTTRVPQRKKRSEFTSDNIIINKYQDASSNSKVWRRSQAAS